MINTRGSAYILTTIFKPADKMHVVTLVRSAVLQGKIKESDTRALAPTQQPKTDKVQIFGFSF